MSIMLIWSVCLKDTNHLLVSEKNNCDNKQAIKITPAVRNENTKLANCQKLSKTGLQSRLIFCLTLIYLE